MSESSYGQVIILLTWLLPSIVAFTGMVQHCDWFDFVPRRVEYVMFALLAVVWPITALVAIYLAIDDWRHP